MIPAFVDLIRSAATPCGGTSARIGLFVPKYSNSFVVYVYGSSGTLERLSPETIDILFERWATSQSLHGWNKLKNSE